MMQAGEKRAMLKGLGDESVHILLKGQVNADAHRAGAGTGMCNVDAFVCGLHKARTSAGDDVAVALRELGGKVSNRAIYPVVLRHAGGAEDGDAVALALRRANAGEAIYDFPEVENRGRENA